MVTAVLNPASFFRRMPDRIPSMAVKNEAPIKGS
jgi:hypothetical protein